MELLQRTTVFVWYSESGVQPNTLIAFDPKTKSFQSWPIPSGGGVVEKYGSQVPDDKLYLACSQARYRL